MATAVPPKKNTAYVFYTGLILQSDTKLLKANPTLATGDAKVSIDGGAFANLATLPAVTPAAGTAVKISLSSGEMNGDNIVVTLIDAAGAEWCDQLIELQTVTKWIDDLSTQASVDAVDDFVDTEVAAILAAVDTEVGAIKTKTDQITFTTANRVDSQVFGIQANAITATAIAADAITDAKVASDVTIASVTGAVGSVTGAVGSVAGAVGSVTGAVGSVTGAVGSVTGNVGGNVIGTVASVAGAVGSVTGLTASDVGSIKAKTDSLTFTVAGKVDANPTAINGDATSAASLAKTTRAIGRGTVTAAASTTSIPTSAFTPSGAVADQFKGRIITFDSDTTSTALRGQSTDITASSNAAAPTFTCTALTTAPASGDTFSVT